jgi:hypothetical protein
LHNYNFLKKNKKNIWDILMSLHQQEKLVYSIKRVSLKCKL